ncbi:acetyl esterase/lipase [Thermocatellispora tengchongensis]|uniref:Acetyl esterase/lipase n=1 Tax=Thermocatellispora tengchongensis TaxID=1073253 RepID=A0A840P0A2_9ACTN|nr:alpha/beta hydrolase [Thermocatellispora tengchongensis]MBB5132409.1 acetyl esterase/lipase [Thermocatellispora tengchongensis]
MNIRDSRDITDRIDPQVRARLDRYLRIVGPQGLSGIENIAERRRRQAELAALRSRAAAPRGVEVRDHSIPVGTGPHPAVRVRVYRPPGGPAPAPCVCYIHGGGMVAGSVDGDDAKAAELARETGCVVVSVEYRLAPENPYPAAVDDCFTALRWTAESHRELRIDPDRIALYGPSAGGCLAAATTLLARDRGGPEIAYLMLVSPMLDDRSATPSTLTNTGFGAWSREANLRSWQAFLGEDFGTDRVSPYAAPARAGDLTGFPPAYVDVGDLDLFRDEAMDFARRLMWAGVPVELHVYPGGIHGGESLAPEAELSVRVRSYRHSALRRALCANAG